LEISAIIGICTVIEKKSKMESRKEPVLRIPESVRQDVLGYRASVAKFTSGRTKPISFKAYRVPMGIYEQRAEGRYMVRIRIGAGLVLPHQLDRIAELSKTFGNGIVHVTTRQDIQIHEVDIEDTPDVLEGLLEVGLSARGGGGNTVRNVTACPRAGICSKEQFDVAPYAIAAAEYLLQFKSSYNLPRKYKLVFSGCSSDCAFASVADVGFFAHVKKGVKGFSVYAGGGLGGSPAVGVKVEDFIAGDEILEVAEAVRRVFDKHGDRANKHKARLRYVLARVGQEEFVRMYKGEREQLSKEGLEGDIPEVRDIGSRFAASGPSGEGGGDDLPAWANVTVEKTNGLYTVRLRLNLGDISAEDLAKVGAIAAELGCGLVRTTQLQNLLITSVPRDNVEKVASALETLGVDIAVNGDAELVACTGAATCKLGLCLSRGLAAAIKDELGRGESAQKTGPVIRISGCSNSCGHHFIADIGFQGRAKRVDGRLMPCYDVLAGAKTVEGDAHLAERIGTVPAKRAPKLLAEAFAAGAFAGRAFEELVGRYDDFAESEFPEEYFYDYGSDEPFSLAGRGPGECGAGVMDVIKVDIDEARGAIKAAAKQAGGEKDESLYKAAVAAARSLLVISGLEPTKDREIFAAFKQHLIEPGWVVPQTQQLLDEAVDWRMGDRESIGELAGQVEDLVKRVVELFGSLDAGLKFKVEPVAQAAGADEDKAESGDHIVDLRGVACPLNFVKAKIELEKIPVGEVLGILLDGGEPMRNVPDSFVQQGQEVLETKNLGDHFCMRVRRKK